MQGLKYKKILLPLDNSEHSDHAMEAALAIAALHASEVTGCHVYAARLHEARFMDMEKGLPPQYRSESVLKRQREVHGDLIEKGLNIVADSYLDRLEEAAGKRGVTTRRRNLEGKNWVELLKEAGKGDYDLVTMGGLGKGKVELSLIGGVSERVARGITKDILVTKTGSFDGKVVACIDGSPSSYGALEVAIALSLIFGGKGGKGGKVGKVGEVEALAVFDPYFHQVAFRNIAGALSDEAARLFKFEEQEKLHDEIIDSGLARLYESYLERACEVAKELGAEITTTLLAGKAFDEIVKHVRKGGASFVVLGRFGMHRVAGSPMGTTAENVLRAAAANVLISNREVNVFETKEAREGKKGFKFNWTEGALKRLEKIPPLVRGMALMAIEEHAAAKGSKEITEELMDEVKKRFGM